MTPMVPLVMFSWFPLAIFLFSKYQKQPRHGVIIGYLYVWMFFPWHEYSLPGPFNYNKTSAAAYGILLGTLAFQPDILKQFKWSPWDLPITIWCLVPFFTSISNGLGAYDGVSSVIGRTVMWGFPYFLGRIYFNSRPALEDLAIGFFLGALIYLPFCWYEIVMSPRLHRLVYGFHPHSFGQAKRAGGWRPVIFTQHGLMNSMFMVTGTLSAFTLVLSGRIKQRFPQFQSFALIGLGLLLMTIPLLKSVGALFLLILGIGVLFFTIMIKKPYAIILLACLPLLYAALRSTQTWDAQNLLDAAARLAEAERVGSLEYRINNENILVDHAWKRPLLGWGEWGRSFVRNEEGEIISVPDGQWILAFGRSGFIGLISVMLVFFLPPLFFVKRFPASQWKEPATQAILALPLLIVLFALDNLMNDMFNPLLLILAGAITGMHIAPARADSSTEAAAGIPGRDTVLPPFPRLL